MINLFGIAIGGLTALVLVAIGLFGLFAKGGLASSIRGIFGRYSKLALAIVLVLGLMAGGITYGMGLIPSISTASAIGTAPATSSSLMALDCRFNTPSGDTNMKGNATFRSDPNSVKHYYVDVKESQDSNSINGTLSCDRSGDVSKGGVATCQIVGATFKNAMSTTDSNTYTLIKSTASASRIAGLSWAETAYLNDNAVATTSSDSERTQLTFAQDESNQKLGYYFTLPTNTVWGYLNNQSSNDVVISCDGKEQARLTINKVGGVTG